MARDSDWERRVDQSALRVLRSASDECQAADLTPEDGLAVLTGAIMHWIAIHPRKPDPLATADVVRNLIRDNLAAFGSGGMQ